jgi:Asp-tRNA(Asn)/Glu-tRNA(Gln) amidotransferase C subunit
MKLTNFKREDVTKAASQIRGVIAALEVVGQVPHDIVERLLDIFQINSTLLFV